jgi:hypothetical protein
VPIVSGRNLRGALAVAWASGLLWLTLTPGSGTVHPSSLCIVCGDTGIADALLNVAGFVPLGLLLGVRRSVLAALLAGVLLSLGIEIAQLWIPGRFPTLADVIWNGLGAGMGAILVRLFRLPAGSTASAVTGGFVVLFLLGWFHCAGLLLVPVRSEAPYHGQWTPAVAGLEHYEGHVLEASLNGAPVPAGSFPPGAQTDAVLSGDWTLQIRAIKGPAPTAIAPLIRLRAHVGILYFAVDGEDLVWHERTRAQALGLQTATDVRFVNALAGHRAGDIIELSASREGERLCLGVGATHSCSSGVAPSRTWALLMKSPASASPWILQGVDLAWMAALLFPIGLIAGSWRTAAALAAVAVGGMLVAAGLTPLAAPGWLAMMGVATGVAVGRAMRPLVRMLLTGESA